MEKRKYDILKKISIENSGIILCNINDSVYKFCVLNNIDNLGDFIETYNKQRYMMDGRSNFYYFDGIVDLINLVFFDEKLSDANCLCKKIKIFKYDRPLGKQAYVERDSNFVEGRSKNAALRRLGFNNMEAKAILGHVLYLDKEVTIINAIKSCLNSIDFNNMNCEKEMFINKLYIISQYYDKYNKDLDRLDSYEFYKACEDISELKKLYRKLFNIKKSIVELSCDFEDNIQKLPQNESSVKKLIKIYQDFNCKED